MALWSACFQIPCAYDDIEQSSDRGKLGKFCEPCMEALLCSVKIFPVPRPDFLVKRLACFTPLARTAEPQTGSSIKTKQRSRYAMRPCVQKACYKQAQI